MVNISTYYDEHPINQVAIENALIRLGKSLESLVPEDLFDFDQDHYGGLAAVDALAISGAVQAGDRVLDVCSGMGGPARYLAHNYGCSVTGIDINQLRTAAARQLTSRVALGKKVSFVCGDATKMPFESKNFSKIISQEAFLHIPDKASLFANCWRVLQPGGCLTFTDWIASPRLTDIERGALGEGMAATAIHDENDYVNFLSSAGFVDAQSEDISAWWSEILRERLRMYQTKKEETENLFGVSRHREFMEAYEIFVQAMEERRLGGARFKAFRDI